MVARLSTALHRTLVDGSQAPLTRPGQVRARPLRRSSSIPRTRRRLADREARSTDRPEALSVGESP